MRKINTKAAKAASANKAAKAAPKAAKAAAPAPVQAAKPVMPESKPEQRQAIEARVISCIAYDGSSPVIHAKNPGKHGAYVSRIQNPVQRVAGGDINGNSRRDDSLLAVLQYFADKSGKFDPVALAADLGAISRAASTGAIAYDAGADAFTLTPAGLARGKFAFGKFCAEYKAA